MKTSNFKKATLLNQFTQSSIDPKQLIHLKGGGGGEGEGEEGIITVDIVDE